MTDPTTRVTRELPGGRAVEAEAEERGGLVRLRARLIENGLIVVVVKKTADLVSLLTRREFLPKEFADDPKIEAAVFEPLEEIWRDRLRLWRG